MFLKMVLQSASDIQIATNNFNFNTLIGASISYGIRLARCSTSFGENQLDLFSSRSLDEEPRFLVVKITDAVITS